jgi:hypothetical protein
MSSTDESNNPAPPMPETEQDDQPKPKFVLRPGGPEPSEEAQAALLDIIEGRSPADVDKLEDLWAEILGSVHDEKPPPIIFDAPRPALTCSVRDIVDFNALLLRWPGFRAAHLVNLTMKSDPLTFQSFRISFPEYNVRDQSLYYQLMPLSSLAELRGKPDYDRVIVENDSESNLKMEDAVQTFWGVGFIRQQIEEYENEHDQVFRFEVMRIPQFSQYKNLKPENYLDRDQWSFEETAERWGYGPDFLRFKLKMGHIGSSAFRHDTQTPILSRDICEIVGDVPNEQITFSYERDIEQYERAWPPARTHAAAKTRWRSFAGEPKPAFPESPSAPLPPKRRGHNLPAAQDKKQANFDDRWKKQALSGLAAAVFCFQHYEAQQRPVTKAEYYQFLNEHGYKALMVETEAALRKILPKYLLHQGDDKKD